MRWDVVLRNLVKGLGVLWVVWSMGFGRDLRVDAPVWPDGAKLDCVSYTPYEAHQSPADFAHGAVVRRERLDADLQLIAQHAECIRVYSVQGLGELPAVARANHLKILLGGWVNADAVDTRRELARVVAMARANPDVIRAVIVGNEALLRKEVTAAQLIDYLRWVRAQLPGVPVTYADVWEFWLANPTIASAVDFATIHVLPYWENEPMPAARAVEHLEHVLAEVTHAFPQTPLMVGETGWPTEGRARQQSRANRATAAEYIQRVTTALREKNIPYNIIEAFDQPWKRGSEGTVGGYWGLFDAQRVDKGLLWPSVSNVPDWPRWCYWSVGVWSVLLLINCRLGRNLTGPVTQILLLFSSAALVWQAREYSLAVRNNGEVAWAIAILVIAACSIAGAVLTSNRLWLQRMLRASQLATLGVIAITALEMAVDARYRAFPNAALSVAVLGWWAQARAGVRWTPRNPLAWAVLLIGCGAANLWDETIWNLDALWWAAILALAVRVLCAEQSAAAWRAWFARHWSLLAVIAGSAAATMVLRYRVMESTALVELCATQSQAAWCQVRDTAGLLIHYRYLGTTALLLAAMAAILPAGRTRRIGTLMALIAATCGLTLYGVDRAAWGFLAAWALVTYDSDYRSAL